MNEDFVSEKCFYEAQIQIEPVVSEYVNESMAKARSLCVSNTDGQMIVSGDGRYPIKKNSAHCSFDVFDYKHNKVQALGVADKQSVYHPNGTFNKTSNMLESEAMKRAIEQLKDIKVHIYGFSLDGDNKNKKVLESDDFNPVIFRDPNHFTIFFERYLNTELPKYKRMIPTISDAFRGLRDKIKVWYSYLIHSQFDFETKKKGWINTVEHFIGYHFDCIPHEPTNYVWKVGLNSP